MSRFFLLAIFTFFGTAAMAQEVDSIFTVRKGPGLAIRHIIVNGENISMLAHRFYSTHEKIEGLNPDKKGRKVSAGDEVFIPLSPENYVGSQQPMGIAHQEPVYYRVKEKDNVALISICAGIKKSDLIIWNSLHGNSIAEGQVLFIGFVKKVPQDSINVKNGIAYPSTKRFYPHDDSKTSFTEMDSVYNAQTRNGENILKETGTAVFFEKPGKNDKYYAFHNTSTRGSIIKVYNKQTEKTVFVQVIGPIPETKQYANCIIAICNTAKDALGVAENKSWVELSYSPN